eukprot:TRINITY_DN1686_c0_g1_i25.p1 TRINITY_DN1686_c0_g1~~TRINITY_DN1686_c0_g1_i25.p1  ORF type:complete len:152 (-),score=15.52 TRINITY_DN1686_c0_g1_i25:82-537(-)
MFLNFRHDPYMFPWVKDLEDNWKVILEEATNLNSLIDHPEKNICNTGWKLHVLWAFKNRLADNCALCPHTTKFLSQIPNVSSAIFSYLAPRAHIKPHFGYYQYSEGILRVHLGLVVPRGCTLKVNGIEKQWEEGKVLIFDDTFRHEAWNPS